MGEVELGSVANAFAAAMDRLGPFEPAPAVAVAVSGGPDSMALATLAQDWVRRRNGNLVALVVDHGLRPTSFEEARSTVARLEALAVPARMLRLLDLNRGPALAERARIGRYRILTEACHNAGMLHLLLGHQALDQAETLAMRVLRGSRTHGLAGMTSVRETERVRLLRPLLAIDPLDLRRMLTIAGIGWIDDPSNRDMRAMRPRLRHRLAAHAVGSVGLLQAAAAAGRLRVGEEREIATELAHRVKIWPEGFALLSPGRISPGALSGLIQTIGGSPYPVSPDQIAELAAQPRPATIAGVCLTPARAFGNGLLIAREDAAIGPPIEVAPDVIWDNRFRLVRGPALPPRCTIGKLGVDAAGLRAYSSLPAAILRTLPSIRCGKILAAVPHLRYASNGDFAAISVAFSPPKAASGPCFVPAEPAACSPNAVLGCCSP